MKLEALLSLINDYNMTIKQMEKEILEYEINVDLCLLKAREHFQELEKILLNMKQNKFIKK